MHLGDILKLEYLDNIGYYYKYFYRMSNLNRDLTCDLGKYIMASIESKTVTLHIKFGHTETMI